MSSKAKYPWMPLYGDDFFADIEILSNEEVGAYLRLLWYQWKHGSVPGFATDLQRICNWNRADSQHDSFEGLWLRLKQYFRSNGKRLYNNRCSQELEKRKIISKARSAAVSARYKRPTNVPTFDPTNDPTSHISHLTSHISHIHNKDTNVGEGDVRKQSEEVRDHFFRLFKRDQTWTKCLSHIDWRLMEDWTVEQLKLAADRYRQEVPKANIPVSCSRFYQDDFKEFLREGWTPPADQAKGAYRDKDGKVRFK